jgi:hypothetical protein
MTVKVPLQEALFAASSEALEFLWDQLELVFHSNSISKITRTLLELILHSN